MTPDEAPPPAAPPSPPDEMPEHEPLPRPRREVRWLVIGLTVALVVTGLVTTALSPALAAKHPLLLLALEAPLRNMLLASRVPAVPFLVVITLRRTVGAVLYYLLGRWYGDAAVRWLERHAGRHGAKVRKVETAVRAGAYPLVFVAPTAVVSTVAGAMGLPPVVFVSVSSAGSLTIGTLALLAGDVLKAPITWVVGIFEHHLLGATVAAAIIAAGGAAWHWYPARGGAPPTPSDPPPGAKA